MQSNGVGYSIDPATLAWFELPVSRGFAGYGLGRALGLLLDAMRGLSALNETTTASGATFAHGEFTPSQLRVDPLGVCRLVPLTTRHYISDDVQPPRAALGFLSPERLIGETVGVRADVFSAGVLLWEALAGRRLTELESTDLIIDRLMSQRLRVPPLPPQLAWATPLKAAVERALSVNEKQRFADCAEFSAAILRVAQDRVASQAEIAEFFASNFRTAPNCAPNSAPSSAPPSAASVSRERPIANRGATFRMLPAVSQPNSPSNPNPAGSGPRRHTTLKMNVTLKIAPVPLPIAVDVPLLRPPPPPSLCPAPPSPRPSQPPPLPAPTLALPPPLPAPTLALPPPLPAPTLALPPPLREPTHSHQQPQSSPPSPAPKPASTTPVPTCFPAPERPTPASLPAASLPAPTSLPARASRLPSAPILALTTIVLFSAIVAVTLMAVKKAASRRTPDATAFSRAPSKRSASLPITASSAATAVPLRDEAPRLDRSDGDARAVEVDKLERAVEPPLRNPKSRPVPGGALPRGKDYGI